MANIHETSFHQGQCGRVVTMLEHLHDQVARFQEHQGIPRENYNFITLMSMLFTLAGQSIHSLFSLMLALAPVTEVALHIARFVLEGMVDIVNTTDKHEVLIKSGIFALQLIMAFLIVLFIFGSILVPVWTMGIVIVSKVMYYITGQAIVMK